MFICSSKLDIITIVAERIRSATQNVRLWTFSWLAI